MVGGFQFKRPLVSSNQPKKLAAITTEASCIQLAGCATRSGDTHVTCSSSKAQYAMVIISEIG